MGEMDRPSTASRSVGASAIRSRLATRTLVASAIMFPLLAAILLLRMVPSESAMMAQLAISLLPFLTILMVAAMLPTEIPPSSAGYISASLIVLAAMAALAALRAVHVAEHPHYVRSARAAQSWAWATLTSAFAVDTWKRRATRFWPGLRLTLTLGNGLRLAIVCLLQAQGAAPGSFPPGSLTFGAAVVYNLACLALSTLGLCAPLRHRLCELFGGPCFVLSLGTDIRLSEIAGDGEEEQDGGGGAAERDDDHEAASDSSEKSWCTMSAASTTQVDHPNFAFGPLNSLDFVEGHLQLQQGAEGPGTTQ